MEHWCWCLAAAAAVLHWLGQDEEERGLADQAEKGRGRQKKEGQTTKINMPKFGYNRVAAMEAFLFIAEGFSRYFQGILWPVWHISTSLVLHK